MSDQKPPAGLKASGRRLWAAIADHYILTPAELANLAEACRTADECDRLEKAVRALPDLVVPGSTGQPKVHPLLEEVRRHRLLLERLTNALNLPDDNQEVGIRGASRHASKAARDRWRERKEAQNGDASTAAWRTDAG
jgi:hypothetical protein